MGVPFPDVVEFGVLISGAGEKSLKPPKSIFYKSNKRGDRTSLVYRDVPNLESVGTDVRGHQHTAYFTLSGAPQCSEQFGLDITWKYQRQHAPP